MSLNISSLDVKAGEIALILADHRPAIVQPVSENKKSNYHMCLKNIIFSECRLQNE